MSYEIYPLSEPQKRIWYTQMIHPGSSMFIIGGLVTINGEINLQILENAICLFINSHDAFQIRIRVQSNEPYQYFVNNKVTRIEMIDLSNVEKPKEMTEQIVDKEFQNSFGDLIDIPLYKFILLKIDANTYSYMVKLHHIIADGWSVQILTNEISQNYINILNSIIENDIESEQYKNYIKSELEYLSSPKYYENKQYWNKQFIELPKYLPVASNEINGQRDTYYLDLDQSENVREYCKSNMLSLAAFFISIYYVYSYMLTGEKDIIVGTPVLGRTGKKERKTFGMFVSSLPLRYVINDNLDFIKIVKEIEVICRKNYSNQKYPYNHLIKDLKAAKNNIYGLYDTSINFYGTTLSNMIEGAPIVNKEFYNKQQDYGLQIVIRDWISEKGFQLDFDYKISKYVDNDIKHMFNQFKTLISKVLIDNKKIKEYDLLSKKEKNKLLYEYNDTFYKYPDGTIIDMFINQVKKTSDRYAVICNDMKITYKDLDIKSDILAVYLKTEGIDEGDIVGLIAKHSIETIISILAIFKVGAIYLPVDHNCPENRLLYILKDSQAKLVLTNIKNLSYLTEAKVIYLEEKLFFIKQNMQLNFKSKVNNIAYIIYTSGTTGNPKGVLIEHKALKNYIYWAKNIYVTDDVEIFPLYTNLAFDLTVTSIFTPLISGGVIKIYEDNNSGFILNKIIGDNECTIIKLTPTHLRLLEQRDYSVSKIKKMIIGGEILSTDLVANTYKNFNNDIIIFNEYGPTESTVGCMIYKYDPTAIIGNSVPIGKPIDNCKIYLLNENLQPLPLGSVGEIYISGESLARGYLNSPQKTSESFIYNERINKNERLYKTGDYGKFISEDCIEYFGRKDGQIKRYGYRIEINEIENKILQFGKIRNVFILAKKSENNVKIIAYYMPDTKIDLNDLSKFLHDELPAYMIPDYFVNIEVLPITSNGKIDVNMLPDPEESYQSAIESDNKKEILLYIISLVLNIEDIKLSDNFYKLGGDSIKAIQLSSKLKDKGFLISVNNILAHPILNEMIDFIDPITKNDGIYQISTGYIETIPIYEWFFNRVDNLNTYLQFIKLDINIPLGVEILEEILKNIVRTHDSLRLNYLEKEKKLHYSQFDLNNYSIIREIYVNDEKDIYKQHQEIINDMNINNGLLLKSLLIHLENNKTFWFIYVHHLAIDGVSWRIILDDIEIMIEQFMNNNNLCVRQRTESFQRWAEKLNNMRSEFIDDYKYWGRLISMTGESKLCGNALQLEYTFTNKYDFELLNIANTPYKTKTEELLLAALLASISINTKKNNVIVEIERHGRNLDVGNIDISHTVGWFTYFYPVLVNLLTKSIIEQLIIVKDTLRKIPNSGIGFSLCDLLSNKWNDENQWIRFNYLGELKEEYKYFNVEYNDYFLFTPNNSSSCWLEIDCMIVDKSIKVISRFSTEVIDSSAVYDIINNFENNFHDMVVTLSKETKICFTPSDFDTIELTQDELNMLLTGD